jgi:hypothetical protein
MSRRCRAAPLEAHDDDRRTFGVGAGAGGDRRADLLARTRAAIGAWSGVDHRSATAGRLTQAAGVPVVLSLATEGAPVRVVSETSDGNRVATFALGDLAERTRYRYSLRAHDEAVVDGAFRTFGSGSWSFRVVFASCAETGSSAGGVQNWSPTCSSTWATCTTRYRRRRPVVFAGPTMRCRRRRSGPVAVGPSGTWTTTTGPNNADRTSRGRLAASDGRIVVPHLPTDGGDDAPIRQAFTVGRARFVMTTLLDA